MPSREPKQVRGVLAERIIVSTPLDPFLSLRTLVNYSDLSIRKLRELLDDPVRPLPHYRIGGKILVRRSEFDAWMVVHRHIRPSQVSALVDDVLHNLREA
jgi:hypothetical protein